MKKLVVILILIILPLSVGASWFSDLFNDSPLNFAGTTLKVPNGGTGASTLTGCLEGNGTSAITGTGSACGSGSGGSFPFSPDTNYGIQYYSTSTPSLWFKSGLTASTTSYFGGGAYGSPALNVYGNTDFYGGDFTLHNAGTFQFNNVTDDKTVALYNNGGAGENLFIIDSAGNGNDFVIDNAGNVGISTTTPAYTLDVYGNIFADQKIISRYSSSTIYSSFITASTSKLIASTQITFWDKVWSSFADFTTEIRGLFTGGDHITITAGDIDVDDDFLLNNGDTGTGAYDFSGATVKKHSYSSFSFATSTAWTATTTIALGPASTAELWSNVKCFTDTGTVNVSFNDGTNRMDMLNASTTVGTFTLSTNNTFTSSEKRYVDIGTPASSPTRISCSVDRVENN